MLDPSCKPGLFAYLLVFLPGRHHHCLLYRGIIEAQRKILVSLGTNLRIGYVQRQRLGLASLGYFLTWKSDEGADLDCQGTATAQSEYYGEVGKGAEKRSALGYSERILGVM